MRYYSNSARNFLILGIFFAHLLLPSFASAADESTCVRTRLDKIGAEIVAIDQANRIEYVKLVRSSEPMTAQRQAKMDMYAKLVSDEDLSNLNVIEPIISECGIPIGKLETNPFLEAVFLVVMHAPLPIQQKYLPTLRDAAARKDLLSEALILLENRINARMGKALQK